MFETTYDDEQLLVIDFIVAFGRKQILAVEGDGMKIVFVIVLR